MSTSQNPASDDRSPVAVHTRRAERALKELASEVTFLQRRLASGAVDPDDVRKAAELVLTIGSRFAILETLGGVAEEVQDLRNTHYEQACEHSEMAGHEQQEERAFGRVEAYDEILRLTGAPAAVDAS
jgi:hypothetical protein